MNASQCITAIRSKTPVEWRGFSSELIYSEHVVVVAVEERRNGLDGDIATVQDDAGLTYRVQAGGLVPIENPRCICDVCFQARLN